LLVISLAFRPAFVDFGAWTLAPAHAWPRSGIQLRSERRDNRKRIRRDAPRAPGVYGMVDAEGELIYVGQSKSLRNRLLSYFTAAAPNKAQRIVGHAKRLMWDTAPDEFAAQLRELELIRQWRPRFNVRGQPGRRNPTYLIVSKGPAPRVYFAAVPAKGDTTVFGPVRGRDRQHALHALNDFFHLRTCGQEMPIRFANQREMFDADIAAMCARHDLGICLAPCAMRCSRGQYNDRVKAVKQFLGGTDLSILEQLEDDMRAAAATKRFEEAAIYRDRWNALRNLHEQLDRFRTAQGHYNFIYPVPRRAGGDTWYLIRRGQTVAAIDEPVERRAAEHCLTAMEQVYGSGASLAQSAGREDVEMTMLVASWFRSRPEELKRTLLPARANKRLQAICACAELQ
jgi:excinuclease ABC subunit C